jgi:deoxyribonuclease-1-like protein
MNHKYVFTIFTILILLTVSAGCGESSPSSSNFPPDATPYPSPTPTPTDNLDLGGNQSSDETLRVGPFNIQVFGVTKASKPEVMDVLV